MSERDAKFSCDACDKDCGLVSEMGRQTGNQMCFRPKGCILVWDEKPVFVGRMPVRKDVLVVPVGTIPVVDERLEDEQG